MAALDINQALEMTGGDEDFLKEILEEFMQHSQGQIATLKQAQLEGNNEKLRFEAHAIKGASATVGAAQLSAMALALEKVASGAADGDTHKLVSDLEAEFQRVAKFIQGFLKGEGGGAPPPAIDVAKALDMTGGDVEFLKEVLDEFVQHSDTQMKNLEQGLADKNMQVLRFEAHTIKGSAATIGAMEVSELALRLERVAAGTEGGDAAALVERIKTEFARVRSFVSQYHG